MATVRQDLGETLCPASPATRGVPAERVRVDGKVLARGRSRLRINGVTYGPFVANSQGDRFPLPDGVRADFGSMSLAGVNAVRCYHVPPDWFLGLACEHGMNVLVDVPWPKHVCFLEGKRVQEEARLLVAAAVKGSKDHVCVLGYSVGNEIPPNIVRWHGARRVERFLAELRDVAKQVHPEGLVTYANFPPTEYLDLSFLDFATFNVYLHDLETFRRYLSRLQNIVGDRPLLLGEIGMDAFRHSEKEQADFLAGHVREATLMGLAGSFVFSWTDEWHTGGHAIEGWAFGITRANRQPKPSYHSLGEVFQTVPAALLVDKPRVSVVVCTYNGGANLGQCLLSLRAIDYPHYEVIVIDDGSTDQTHAILDDFPGVRVIHQSNQGLSVSRNTGLQAATGEIVAYTDSDCFADPGWLTHLVYQLQKSGAAAVGGPNLTPDDGRLAACVAASPGQPTHVLESDQVAEHIPGCNMAFRRDALVAINGFDPQFRKAGDDVDVCWRLQQAGYWITFAPGAFVWHHRRQNPWAYLRQQAGYGNAEALLRFKHPEKFNGWGDGKWQGVLYGASLQDLRLDGAIIYRGVFGTGLFQCLYEPGPAHWAMLPSTLEWHLVAGVLGLAALFFWPLGIGTSLMLVLSVGVAALRASQATLAQEHRGLSSRLLIMLLCYAQPLVRSWSRYRIRLFSYRPTVADSDFHEAAAPLPFTGGRTIAYWSEEGRERIELLRGLVASLNANGWGKVIDSGWTDWDVRVFCHAWTVVEICTAQEDHADGKRMLRVRFRLRPTGYLKTCVWGALIIVLLGAVLQCWQLAAIAGLLLAACLGVWWRGVSLAARVLAIVSGCAKELKMSEVPMPGSGVTTQGQAGQGSIGGQNSGTYCE